MKGQIVACRAVVLTMALATGCISSGVTAQHQPAGTTVRGTPFADHAEFDVAVPTPASIIGHPVGATAVRYEPLIRYLTALAESSPFVTMTRYGETYEGRALNYVTITSRENHSRLDQIKRRNAQLADPRKLNDDASPADWIDDQPAIAWLAYGIHGDELSSTDAAMWVAYELAAGTTERIQTLRDELVIHIDPTMNPDGRERYLAQIRQLSGEVLNTDHQAMQHMGLWSAGRGNHYLFDLNRDWVGLVHPETRGRVAAIGSWNPQLLIDSHEMGGLDTYLFEPPREPINVHVSPQIMEWRRLFSADHAKAFDRRGWSYYTQEWYEEWYPGYTNAWGTLIGSIGLLYEQAGVNAAAIKQATGRTLTYEQAVHQQIVSTFANLATLQSNRTAILDSYLKESQWAVSPQGPHNETLLVPPNADAARMERLRDLLRRQGIEFTVAADAFEAADAVDVWGGRHEKMSLPAGTIVVRSDQPRRRLLHALFAFDPHTSDEFLHEERESIEKGRGSRLYDISAWNVPMAYGLDAYWVEAAPAVGSRESKRQERISEAAVKQDPAFGWLIDGASGDVYAALVRLLDGGHKVRAATKPFRIEGREFRPGTVLIRKNENDATLAPLLNDLATTLRIEVYGVDTALSEDGPDLGGRRFSLLQPPRVAIASQWPTSSTSFGAIWHLFDARLNLRVSPINVQYMTFMDLRKYNVIILPNSRGAGLAAVLGEQGAEKLRTWVEAGGTLIAMGNSAAYVIDEDRKLSAVRLKRDVVDELSVYEEAVAHEREARDVQVDPDVVWGTSVDAGDDAELDASEDNGRLKQTPRSDIEALQRADEWQQRFRPRGVIAAALLDTEHWLCFGAGDRLPVLLSGSRAYMSKPPVATPARLAEAGAIRLSGLMWPEARERWASTAYATVERRGRGQVILFATDPFFRGYFEGTGRLLMNAVILGPGMGTSSPVPW